MKLSALATAGGGGSSSGDGIYLGPGNVLGNPSYAYILGVGINTGINASSGVTQVLNLTGPGVISYLRLTAIPNVSASHTIRIIVDGVVKVDSTFTATASNFNLIAGMTTTSGSILIKYDTSFVVEYSNTNATSMTVEYQAIRTQ